MPWLKVDDGEWCQPWVMHVGDTAYGILKRLEGYCAQALTDGIVPGQIVAVIAAGREGELEKLEAVGRVEWHQLGDHRTGSLRLPFYLDHNPTAAQVESDRERRREAGRKGGLKSRRT